MRLITLVLALLLTVPALATPRAPAGPKLVGPKANPLLHLPRAARNQPVVGVMGSAARDVSPSVAKKLKIIGETLALNGAVVLTGACNGMPHEVARAAKKAGGATAGISPWRTLAAHLEHGSPTDSLDVIQFTKLPYVMRGQDRPNFMGREIDNIERSDAVIFTGGRSGTLGEFALAFEGKRPIGVLLGTGGITAELKRVVDAIRRGGKKPAAPIIFDRDPERLVKRVLAARKAIVGKTLDPLGDQ
jgi:hypothetical protein